MVEEYGSSYNSSSQDNQNVQQGQASGSSGITYQTAVLTPGIIQEIIQDDSPMKLTAEFWEFLGVEIPISDIRDYDFNTILLLVNQRFYNILERYPENKWDDIQIVEYEDNVKETTEKGENGEEVTYRTIEKIVARAWNLLEVWGSIETKVRLKMYRARDGFTLDRLTTSRSFVKEESNIPQMYPSQAPQSQGNKGGWRFF